MALADCSCGAESPCIASECDDGLCADGSCAAACSIDAPCAEGFACVDDDTVQGAHCLPVTGNSGIADACAEDLDCASGACSGDVCVKTCTLDDACLPTLRCVLDGRSRVCVPPLDDRDDGAACADAAECRSGTCVRPPTPTDDADAVCAAPCDATHACASDELCLFLLDGARACLPPLDDGTACSGANICAGGFCIADRDGPVCASACEDGSCDGAFVCVDDDDGNAVCMPELDARADGDACVDPRECTSRICGNFIDGDTAVELCASPCPPEGCAADQLCWEGDDVDLCGPIP